MDRSKSVIELTIVPINLLNEIKSLEQISGIYPPKGMRRPLAYVFFAYVEGFVFQFRQVMLVPIKIFALAVILWGAIPQFVHAADAQLDCSVGPLKKTFGGTSWLLYSCTDHKSLVVMTDSGSPAMPFIFYFYKQGGSYQLRGEGTGSKALTDAAYKELSELNDRQIQTLIQQTLSKRVK
ncbi:hypothetical protein ACO0LD_05595 [Undibacterium sp. Ji83W]|uniref:hypothetical protein n=1 Tax=Undibacterium sp. Ji83W TaxID=3413043 RepID=UPI003BF31C4C